MCDVASAYMAISAASAAASAAQQNEVVKNQVQTAENTAEAKIVEYNYAQKNIENESISEKDAVQRELFEQNIEAAKTRSEALAISGTSGVTGQSVADIDRSIGASFGRQKADTERNFDIYKRSANQKSDSSYISLNSALTGLSESVAGTSGIAQGLDIASSGYSGYQAGLKMQ